MKRIVLAALVSALCFTSASAQWMRPLGMTPTGSPICPKNYIFDQGFCKPLYGGGGPGYYGGPPPGYGGPPPGYGGPGGYGGGGVPAQWNQFGSAVCPRNYVYDARRGACFPAYGYNGPGRYYRGGGYGGGGVPARWNQYGSAVCPTNFDYVASRGACFPRY